MYVRFDGTETVEWKNHFWLIMVQDHLEFISKPTIPFFCLLSKLLKKSNQTLLYGEFCDEKVIGDVFTFSRKLNHEKITVFLNFGKKTHTIHTEGKLLLSNYHKTKFDGLLMPYESVIMIQGQ